MLELDVTMEELYDEDQNLFVPSKTTRVVLEHSLAVLSKWESLWKKPFLGKEQKTSEETLSYLEMMIQGDKLPPEVFRNLVARHMDDINSYIASDYTATRLPAIQDKAGYRETVTAELIIYWMLTLGIPMEFQHWHLNRLITQIRVVSLKNSPPKKMSLAERRELNNQRRRLHNTHG